VNENSGKTEKKGVFRAVCIFCAFFALTAFVFTLAFPGVADAVVRHRRIETVQGFRFENLIYSWDKVILDVVNTTSGVRSFEGAMIFLDRRGRTVARANLLPRSIAPQRTQRFNAYFIEGSGETARRATRVLWDFNSR